MMRCDFGFWILGFLFVSLAFVCADDLEMRIGYLGDTELGVGMIGDEENAFVGGAEDTTSPLVFVNSPSEGVTYTSSPIFFNVSMNELGRCNYSLDNGVSNYSMGRSGYSFISTREMANGNYVASFYCADGSGNLNLSESVSFVVSVSSGESSSGSSSSGGGGGGGGASSAVIVGDNGVSLELDHEVFKIRSVVNDVKSREFGVKNNGSGNVEVVVSVVGEDVEMSDGEVLAFSNFVEVEVESFTLDVDEEVDLSFEITAPDSLGIFVGYIVLSIGDIEYEVPVTISTQSKETIFDVTTTVIDDEIEGGENLMVQIDLLPIGEEGVDVTLIYTVEDFSGEVYSENSETFYVDDAISLVREFSTDSFDRGDYVFGCELVYLGGFASASSHFEVVDESIFGGFRLTLGTMFLVGVVLVVILIVIILSFSLRRIRRVSRRRKKRKR